MSSLLSNERSIAVHPEITRMCIALGIGTFFFLLAIVSGIYWIVQVVSFFPVLRLPLPDLESAIEIGLFAGPFTLWCYASLRFWRLIEHRRFAVGAGEGHWLSIAQPDSQCSASPVPQVITLRFKRTYIWFWTGFGLLTVLVFSLNPLEAFLVPHNDILVSFLPMIGFIVLSIFIVGVVMICQSLLTRHTVEATEGGLEARWGREGRDPWRRTSVQWQEARLFTCYKLPKFLGYEYVMYELSSASKVVIWYWPSKPQLPLTALIPLLPVEAYHQQMQTFIALVIEKTGLPLYDLSQPVDGEKG